MINYLRTLPVGILILWCYIGWYSCMLGFYPDTTPRLWLNSLGLAGFVGTALVLATGPLTWQRFVDTPWVIVRLYLCPFCVSSFSAFTKGKGFVLLFSPVLMQNLTALSVCIGMVVTVAAIKRFHDT